MSSSVPLLPGSVQQALPQAGWTNWYVLFVYSYISAQQSLLWITWSSVPSPSKDFICQSSEPRGNVSSCSTPDLTLNLFLGEGPIAYCCVVPLAAWLLVQRNGLKRSICAGAALCFFASVVRSIPALFSSSFRATHPALTLLLIHVGQTINAAVAPLVVASPAFLSLTWFPVRQRNTATSIANVANAVGRAVGLYLGPALVRGAVTAAPASTAGSGSSGSEWLTGPMLSLGGHKGSSASNGDDSGIDNLLLANIGVASIPLICAIFYLPDHPAFPPSAEALAERTRLEEKTKRGSSFAKLCADIRHCLCGNNASLVLLMLSGGLQMAMYGGWSGVLTSALTSAPTNLSMQDAGLLGTLNTLAGIVGGVLTALLCDTPRFNRSLKPIMLLLCALSAVCFGAMALAVPNPFNVIMHMPGTDKPMSYGWLLLLCTAAGFFRGGLGEISLSHIAWRPNLMVLRCCNADPLYFELVAEEAHPIPAGTGGGVLTFFYHALLCVCLTLPPKLLTRWLLVLMAGCMVLSGLLLAASQIRYKRSSMAVATTGKRLFF